jgi:monoamine oxidase
MLEVLVLGAGVAGLTMARYLARAGREVRVVEASARVGGRTLNLTVGEQTFDLGATWVWDHETAIHGLLNELGIATFAARERGEDLVDQATGPRRVRFPASGSPERRIVGGTHAVARALADDLPRGVLQLNREARRIVSRSGHVEVAMHDRDTIAARQVVVAYPPPLVAAQLEGIETQTRERLARTPIWMGDVAKVVAVYERAFWREQGLSGRAFSQRGPMMEIHDLSGPRDEDGTALFGFVPRAARLDDGVPVAMASDEKLVVAATAQLRRIFGADAPRPRQVVAKAWWLERMTVPAELAPADERLFGHPFLREPLLGGRVHLASTETAARNTGHLDGAVRRAKQLADALTATE